MTERVLSTAEKRRVTTIASAIEVFAARGSRATVAEVAAHAGISPAYAHKLFASKEQLFADALQECYARIVAALERGADGADRAEGGSPGDVLHAMGGAYADLIADRSLLMLQVHAQAATDQPVVAEAVRTGLALVVATARRRSGASDEEVQRFIAFGQLCHLLTTVDAFSEDADWARTLTAGVRHPST